jgi:hypothetical protein
MATQIYETDNIILINGTSVFLTPLKIKYLRQFMIAFQDVKIAKDDSEAITALSKCAFITMQQYYPSIKTIEEMEDAIDLPSIYKLLWIAAGIKINEKLEEPIKKQATDSGSTWETLDLAKLESELFLLGIWKDYDELESFLSMPEILATLSIKRELEYDSKKFLAAMQGVDLDKQVGKDKSNAWEEMKARVFSKGKTDNPNDITSLQGVNAQKAGFGIGMGLDYEDLTQK